MKNENGNEKSAILKGQTLVNLCLDNYTLGNIADDGKDYIEKIYPIGTSHAQHSHGYNTVALKPNTTYLAIPKYYTDVPNTRSLVRDQTNNINLTSADVNDRGIVKFTTQDLPCSRIGYYNMIPAKWGADVATQEWISKLSKKIMIIEYVEGMENWDILYFEGIQSVQMPGLTTYGKNLFDKSKTLENCALEGTSNVVLKEWKDYFVSDYIPVKKNEPIFIPYTGSSRKIYCDKNKEYVRQIANSDSYFTPEFDGFIRLTFLNVDLNTYQLEYNTQASSYEP